jgi:glycosyltransferase involved in cell wall biosynthesis
MIAPMHAEALDGPQAPVGSIRVLYVIDSLSDGGAEQSLAHMASAFCEQGIELHVAFLKSRWNLADALTASGATLHPVELDRGRVRQWWGLVQLMRRLDPDVVHTTLWEADVLGRLAATATRRPVIGTFANSSYGAAQFDDPAVSRAKLRLAQLIDFVTERLAVRYHAVSEQVAADMSARMRLPRDRISVIPRARQRDVLGDRSDSRRHAVRASLGIGAEQTIVLAIGRQEYQKGLDVLVDAASVLVNSGRDLTVLIAGRHGRASDDLASQVAGHGLSDVVRFLGSRTDVPDLIVAADLVAVPTRVEGLPGAVLEAMALECPVVATNLPVVIEAIGDHAAALVPVDDPQALATAIAHALDSDHSTGTAAARQRFDQLFTPSAVARSFRALYEKALSTSRWTRRW